MERESGNFTPYPDFLRIFNSYEHSQRLVFPRDYNKYYPKPLPETAVLKKPEGTFWNVKWTISQDETISFEGDGWEKFVKDSGVINRDFLLFTYDGYRTFWIRHHRDGITVETTAPINIQEISDDEDETTGGGGGGGGHHHPREDENTHEHMITSLSLGSSSEESDDNNYTDSDSDDDDDDDDGDDRAICETNKASGSSRKGRTGRVIRRTCAAASVAPPNTYLDNPNNPFFISTSSCSRRVLVIAMQAIRDYLLKFGRTINLIDEFGELKRNVGVWTDRVVVYKWNEMYERNNAKPGDVIICEIIRDENDVVRSIKAHFVKK